MLLDNGAQELHIKKIVMGNPGTTPDTAYQIVNKFVGSSSGSSSAP